MDFAQISCPMTSEEILLRYFIENRSRLLDIAAFLDRIGRSKTSDSVEKDFRLVAFRKAIETLANSKENRVEKIQEILSDHTTEPRESLGRSKSALGAPVNSETPCC